MSFAEDQDAVGEFGATRRIAAPSASAGSRAERAVSDAPLGHVVHRNRQSAPIPSRGVPGSPVTGRIRMWAPVSSVARTAMSASRACWVLAPTRSSVSRSAATRPPRRRRTRTTPSGRRRGRAAAPGRGPPPAPPASGPPPRRPALPGPAPRRTVPAAPRAGRSRCSGRSSPRPPTSPSSPRSRSPARASGPTSPGPAGRHHTAARVNRPASLTDAVDRTGATVLHRARPDAAKGRRAWRVIHQREIRGRWSPTGARTRDPHGREFEAYCRAPE